MGNRRNPNEIPTKMLTPHKQRQQKEQLYHYNKRSVDSFWLNIIKK